jgi:hypothetical protein
MEGANLADLAERLLVRSGTRGRGKKRKRERFTPVLKDTLGVELSAETAAEEETGIARESSRARSSKGPAHGRWPMADGRWPME